MIGRLKLRRALPAFAAVGAFALITATSGAPASASAAQQSACDVTGTWYTVFSGTRLASQGVATIEIKNEHPFGYNPELYGFNWEAVFASNGARANGIGTVLVPANTSQVVFTLDGQGIHPIYGPYSINAQGTGTCAAGNGTDAAGTIQVEFKTDHTSDTGTFVAGRTPPGP